MTLTLTGQLPSGKNQVQLVVRNGRVHKYPNATFTAWRADACKQLLGQFQETIAWPVEMSVDYTKGDLIVRDIPGLMDALSHLFEYAGVIQNDGLIRGIGYWKEHPLDRREPRVKIELKKLS